MYFYSRKLAIPLNINNICSKIAVLTPIKAPKMTLTIASYCNNHSIIPVVSLDTIIYANDIVFHKKLPNFG